MTKFIAHDDNGDIYGIGNTADEAMADGERYGATGLTAIPSTDRLAAKIEAWGWNAANPGYSWHTAHGVADLTEDSE